MAYLGFVALRSEDSQEDAQPMVDAIGKLIINCGLLETYCKNGIFEFEEDERNIIKNCNHQWTKRSDFLIHLVRKHVCEKDLQAEMIQVIQKTKDLMDNFRNSVAHGMVCDQEDGIYIFDSRLCKNPEYGEITSTRGAIRLPEIKQRVDESAALVEEWVDVWERFQYKKRTT